MPAAIDSLLELGDPRIPHGSFGGTLWRGSDMGRTGNLVTAAALLLTVGACGGPEQEMEEDLDREPGLAEEMPGRPGAGMGGGAMMGGPMMQRMRAHMDSMRGLGGDSVRARMGVHRQMVEDMLSQMDEAETGAEEGADALADSVRTDLTRMRDMSAEELRTFMPEHRDRVMRLMGMHGGTTGGS